MSDAFDGFLPPAPHPTSRPARTTKSNPRSQVATDPYLALDVEDFFEVRDYDGFVVFGLPDRYEIHEITHSVAKGRLYGFGHKILRDGTLSARPFGEAILIAWSDIPAHLHERLTP